jgi:hypothetical protein
VASLLLLACSPPSPPAQQTSSAAVDSVPAFTNRIWKVSRSSGVEPGALYVFLSDSTLLIASAHGTPLVGRWTYRGDTLTLVEEGIPHRATARLAGAEFGIRFVDRGAPLEITFTPGGAP